MSNFLTNLVTRSFAPAPGLLRPKLPSLFEAPAANEPILEESLSRATEETISVSPVVRQPNSEQYSAHDNKRLTSQAEPEQQRTEIFRAERQTILPFRTEEQHAPSPTQREEHVQKVSTVRAEESSGEQKQAMRPRAEAVTQSIAKSDKSESTSQGTMPRIVPVLPKREMPRPISESKNDMDAKLFSVEDRSPTVHIHIGRIEVRAVTQSSAPARTSAPNRPRLTLDDYLSRRNEGKR